MTDNLSTTFRDLVICELTIPKSLTGTEFMLIRQTVTMKPPRQQVTTLGMAFHRYGDRPFGIRQADRLFHMYILGQTGTGKSTLLHNMAIKDAGYGNGFCLIDPHGDLAESLHHKINCPHIYWKVSDPTCPYGYNPLTLTSAALRPLVASGLIDSLKKQWSDAWGPRMEHLLRYSILALLDQPRADMRDIMRLFLETDFRKDVLARVSDPQVQQFWAKEYPGMNYKSSFDGVAPIANKLGAFLAHPVVRKAICEPEQPLRFREIMDAGQILIVNLAKGQIGTDLANVLGGLIVSNITNACFTRQSTSESLRKPFMLYVDEFHAFTTESFASVLSETRKYGLGAVLSQQHITQSDTAVTEAILGNVGTLISFRIGVRDAPVIARQLGLSETHNIINQPNYSAFVRLMVDGMQTRAFSMTSLPQSFVNSTS